MSILLLSLLACTGLDAPKGTASTSSTGPSTEETITTTTTTDEREETFAPFAPGVAAMHRLTAPQYRNATEDLLGIRYEGELPPDYNLHGYTSVGAGEIAVSNVEYELYEAAAWELAAAAVPDEAAVEALLGAPYHRDAVADALPTWLAEAWRRPATAEEIDAFVLLADQLAPDHGPVVAVQGVVAATLQAPDFLYRVEVGTEDATDPDVRWLDDHELASRLSFFLTDRPPDALLREAADAGELTGGTGLVEHAERLVTGPHAREALTDWFDQTLELEKIDTLDKDAELYPELEGLLPDMHDEIRELFAVTAYDADDDLAALLTTQAATASPALAAAIYTEGAPAERGGLLGRAGLLAVGAHNTVTSPTHRGKLVRTRLLCGSVPPPPPGVATEIEQSDEGTLRDKLEQHAEDPQCRGCHQAMDPIGYGLEHYDPIGRWRALDNDLPIDATGEVDDLTFDGAAELGEAIAIHPDFPGCMAAQLYRHAVGHAELESELGTIHDITSAYEADGRRLSALVAAIVQNQAFRVVATPVLEPCDEGATEVCETACGEGVDTCVGGEWTGCSAPAPLLEDCNGLDDDCDGDVDEALTLSCTTTWGEGEQVCEGGAWSTTCYGAEPPVEECNGVDDDLDGLIDEDLEVAPTEVTPQDLTDSFSACDPTVSAWNGPCNAAVNRYCGATACAVTGYGPVTLGGDEVVCLDASEATPIAGSFATLGTFHPDCGEWDTHSGPCNAAIHRACAADGLVTGYGPVEHSGDAAHYVCTPNAVVMEATYSELLLYEPYCDGVTERWGWYCSSAIHAWCVDQGYESGHGPLENSGDLAYVACMGAN